jgi:hypothetical protein
VNDRGAVTVEAALAICGLLVVVVLGVGAVTAVIGQLRCADAAREAARLVARGDVERVPSVVERIAPSGAGVVVRREGDTASVEVRARVGGFPLRADAFAVLEPEAEAVSAEG